MGPAGGAATVVLQHPSKLAAAATDGTVYAVPLGGDRIERVGPGGQVDVVAGPGVANSPDGTAATATGMDVAALAVTPDGDRVVYLDGHPSFDPRARLTWTSPRRGGPPPTWQAGAPTRC